MPGSARPCSTGLPIRPTLSKQVRSRTAFAEPCERNDKSDPWRPPFHSASASPYGLRSSRTELYPLNLQRPRVGQIKPPKWAKPTCQKQGDVGVGKTTLIRHLIKIEAAGLLESAVWLHLNLGTQQ